MCLACDGYDDEQIFAAYDRLIAEHGWMIQQVGGSVIDRPPWAYTIGLSHSFDHAELVVVGAGAQLAGPVLNALGDRVRGGEVFQPDSSGGPVGGAPEVGFVEVHPLLWEGPLLTMWSAYYANRGLAPEQRALQVVLPPELGGPQARRWQPCLHDPDCPIGRESSGPDRHPVQQHRRRRRRR